MGSGGAAPEQDERRRRPWVDSRRCSPTLRSPRCLTRSTHPSASDRPDAPDPDLESIAADLADAETALTRLSDGSYWTDELTGEALSEASLDEHPTARRAVYVPYGLPVTSPHGIQRVPPPNAGGADPASTDDEDTAGPADGPAA